MVHEQIARKVLQSGNCLCVLASGLGESLTISAIVKEFLAKSPRVPPLIILVCSETSGSIITGETSNEQRESLYSAGGLVSVTCRVLLSDFLSARLDAALVNLLILPKAHEMSETSNEAFLVRLFREKNGKGMLVALSEKPHRIALDAIVRTLYLSDVVLVPRFHDICQTAFTKSDVSITQHDCVLSPEQGELQQLLENLVAASLTEIGKNKLIQDTSELDMKYFLFEENWNQSGFASAGPLDKSSAILQLFVNSLLR
jgi:DNA excision repair protein ERCC-4